MIAEEVGQVLPEIVDYEENGIDAKGMDYSKLTPLLVEAIKALKYKSNAEEDYIGFIAEDVPELVATKDRKSISTMDIVAIMTKVVQEQQETISELRDRITELERKK